ELDALALAAERIRELGGHRQRDRVRLAAGGLGHDLAHDALERLAVAPDLERAHDDAPPAVFAPHGPGVGAADVAADHAPHARPSLVMLPPTSPLTGPPLRDPPLTCG